MPLPPDDSPRRPAPPRRPTGHGLLQKIAQDVRAATRRVPNTVTTATLTGGMWAQGDITVPDSGSAMVTWDPSYPKATMVNCFLSSGSNIGVSLSWDGGISTYSGIRMASILLPPGHAVVATLGNFDSGDIAVQFNFIAVPLDPGRATS
jgi:hypothetical protein